MSIFSSFFGRDPDLNASGGTRAAMRSSYQQHIELARRRELPVPPGTSEHEAALFGALASRYAASGTTLDALVRLEPVLWLELLPFLNLPVGQGVEALVEYVVWKETETTREARTDWLAEQVYTGTMAAMRSGKEAVVKRAMSQGPDGQGHLPWVELIGEKLNIR
jgi:hypothetical protein